MFINNQIVKEWTVIKRAEDRYIGRNQKRVFYGPVNQQLQNTLEKIAEINTELLDANLKVKYEENKKQASNKFEIPSRQNSSV